MFEVARDPMLNISGIILLLLVGLGREEVVEVEGALGVVVDVGHRPPDAVRQDAGALDVVGAAQDAPDAGGDGEQGARQGYEDGRRSPGLDDSLPDELRVLGSGLPVGAIGLVKHHE